MKVNRALCVLAVAAFAAAACSGQVVESTLSPASVAPSSSLSARATLTPTPSSRPASPTPQPRASYGQCRPYGPGRLLTLSPVTGRVSDERDLLVACGPTEWRSALEPVVVAVNRDRANFGGAYFASPQLGEGSWRMVINVVADADGQARDHVDALIQDGAPVEWRAVERSMTELDRLSSGQLTDLLAPFVAHDAVVSWGVDVKSNGLYVETRGEQPDLVALLEQHLGDLVRVQAGPA